MRGEQETQMYREMKEDKADRKKGGNGEGTNVDKQILNINH